MMMTNDILYQYTRIAKTTLEKRVGVTIGNVKAVMLMYLEQQID